MKAVRVTEYPCTDGRVFRDRKVATRHQAFLHLCDLLHNGLEHGDEADLARFLVTQRKFAAALLRNAEEAP